MAELYGMVWTLWRSNPPPKNTYVIARYNLNEAPMRAKTCRHGCCIDVGHGSMTLPGYWAATDDQMSPPAYAWKPDQLT